MATWDETDLGEETCQECGAEYSVIYESLPLKDDDQFVCFCGNVMRSWRETGMYKYTLISEGE